MTKPYWNYNPKRAMHEGLCVAEFNQVSNFYPVNNSGEKVELPNGIRVLGRVGKV